MLRNGRDKRGEQGPKTVRAGHDDPFGLGLLHAQEIEPGVKRPGDQEHRARTYYLRGLSHEARGEYALAIREYDRAIRLDQRLAWAYYHRGIAHGNMGDPGRRAEDLREAARLGLRIAIDMLALSGRVNEKPGDNT
jgi:tetratricopeptide (TPR) repeat protein